MMSALNLLLVMFSQPAQALDVEASIFHEAFPKAYDRQFSKEAVVGMAIDAVVINGSLMGAHDLLTAKVRTPGKKFLGKGLIGVGLVGLGSFYSRFYIGFLGRDPGYAPLVSLSMAALKDVDPAVLDPKRNSLLAGD